MTNRISNILEEHAVRLEWLMILGLTYFFFALSEGSFLIKGNLSNGFTNLLFTFLVVFSSRKLYFMLSKKFMNPLPTANTAKLQIGVAIIMTLILFVTILNYLYIHLYWREHLLDTRFFDLILPLGVVTFLGWLLKDIFIQSIKASQHSGQLPKAIKQEKYHVTKGKTSVIIPSEAIAFFLVKNQITYLTTFEKEQFILDKSLGQIETKMDMNLFYRVNRQMIVNKNFVSGYQRDIMRN